MPLKRNRKWLERFRKPLGNEVSEPSATDSCGLSPLTPTLLDDQDFEVYENEFKLVFSKSETRNVAISGNYSAGKSSVMKSLEARKDSIVEYPLRYMYVSLAHFKGSADDSALEGEILNQIIHKTDPRRVPRLGFKRTQRISWWHNLLVTAGIVLFLASLLICAYSASEYGLFGENGISRLPIVTGAMCFFLLGVAIFNSIRKGSFRKIVRRIKLFGNEVEVFESNGQDSSATSPFNRHMDEILYLLNNSGFNVLVFEDLDRFDSVELFEKLRALNTLVNDSRGEDDGTIRFFYLIRDDFFQDATERVKFFDYIIPVIPYTNTTNSFDVLRKGLKAINLGIDEAFLYELSLYIDDSRILKDIINETYHYREALFISHEKTPSDVDAMHIVSLVAYKVIFPEDFANFQNGHGYARKLLEKRTTLVSNRKKKLLDEKADLTSSIADLSEQRRYSIDEVALLLRPHEIPRIENDFPYPSNQLSKLVSIPEMIGAIRENESASDHLDRIIESLHEDEEFSLEANQIDTVLEDKKARLEKRVLRIEEELVEVNRLTVADLVQGSEGESFFELTEDDFASDCDFHDLRIESVRASWYFPLLVYLISTGMIDDSAVHYISNPHPEGLSALDRTNLTSIIQGTAIPDNYIFEKPRDIVLRIKPESFMRPSSRNPSLIRALILYGDTTKIKSFFTAIKHDEDFESVAGFVLSDQFIPRFFEVLDSYYSEANALVLASNIVTDRKKRIYAYRFFLAEKSIWNNPDANAPFLDYANNDPLFLSYENNESETQGLIDKLASIGFSTSFIELSSANQDAIEVIYAENLYVPNFKMVSAWLKTRLGHHEGTDRSTLISCLLEHPDEPIVLHCSSHINALLSSLLADSTQSITDNEKAILWVLTNEKANRDLVSKYISRVEKPTITDITTLNNQEQVNLLIKHKVAVPNAHNVFSYYESNSKKIDTILGSFLNSYPSIEELTWQNAHGLLGSNSFSTDMIKCPEIENDNLRTLLGNYHVIYNVFPTNGLSDERVDVLIECGVLKLTKSILKTLRSDYPDKVLALIEQQPREYIELVIVEPEESGSAETSDEFDEAEVLSVLDSEKLTAEEKIQLLPGFAQTIKIKSLYPDSAKTYILRNSFDDDDLALLSELFASSNEDLRQASAYRAVVAMNQIMQQDIALSGPLITEISEQCDCDRDARLSFWTHQLELQRNHPLTRDDLSSWFEAASETCYGKLMEGPQSNIPNTNEDRLFLEALERKNFCGDWGKLTNDGFIIAHSKGYKRSGIKWRRS